MEAANKYQDDIKAATERREAQEIARRAAEETEAEELIKAQQARLQPRLSSSRTSKRGKNTYQPASHDTASPPYPSASASPPPSFAPTSDGFDDDDDDDGASAAGVFDFFDGADDAGSMTEGEKSEDTEEEAVGEGKTTEDDHGEGSGAEDDGDEETGEEQEQIKATEGKGKEKARETPFDKPADPQVSNARAFVPLSLN